MSNPEVKIRLSLDGAGKVRAEIDGVADGLEKFTKSQARMGQQAQISGQQVAQVSAQLQDLFIQIQGGQAPLTALLQQGSQLSTVFGGVGAAARAVSGTVAAMINPFTVAAGAVGVLAVGYYKGAQEAQEFNKTLIMTGNAAGVTAGQLSQLSESVARLSGGTQARAAEVLNQMAASGRVGAQNLERFTAAAISMERAGGAAADATAKAFADLAKAPFDAVLKLNDAQNFLTASTIKQIAALEDQGRTTEAAKLAQEAYASALEQRTPAMLENLGLVERAWLGIKDAAKGAGDAILDIGRSQSPLQQQIKELEGRIAANNRDAAGGGQTATEAIAKGNAILVARLRLLQQAAAWEEQSAAYQSQQNENTKALAAFTADASKFLDSKARMQRELNAETERGQKLVEAGLIKQAELNDRLAAIRAKYANKSGNPGDPFSADRAAAEEWAKFYTRFSDLATEAEASVLGLSKAQKVLLEYLKSTSYKEAGDEARKLALEQAYAAITLEQLGEAQKESAKIAAEASKEYERYIDSLTKGGDQVAAQVLRLREEEDALALSAAGYGSLAQSIEEVTIRRLQEQQAIQMSYGDESAVLAIQKEIDARRELIGLIGNKEARASALKAVTDEQRAIEDSINSVDRTAQRVWTDFSQGGTDAAKRVGNTIKSAIWDMLYQLTVRKWVINVAANVLGVPGGNVLNAASGGSNLLNAAGTAANAYGMVSGASSLSLLTANATGAMGGDALGSLIASNSGNWGVSAAGTSSFMSSLSAAGPYVAAAAILYSIAKSLDDSGTVHTGASSQYSASGGLATGMGVYGVGSKAGSYGVATEEMTTQVTKSIVGILDSTASTFGKQAGYAAAAGFADDTSKDGAWGALTIKLGDKIVEGFGQDGNGRWPGMSFADGQAGTQEYLAAVSADVRRALDDIGLPGWAEGMLDRLGEAPSLDQLAETVAVINATQSALVSLGQAMPQLAGLTDEATTALLGSFDGIQGLASAAQTYYEAFYSAGERSAATISQIGNTLNGLGLSMPATRDQYRALVEAQDLNTESGRKAYATLLQLSGSFASVVSAADEAGASVDALAEQMAEAGQRMLSRLSDQTQALQIELLTAQGDTIAAAALRRQTDLAGLTGGVSASDAAAAAAIYDYNNALRQQIDQLEAAAEKQKAEADRLKAVAAERYDLEGRILSLEGNTQAVRARQLSQLDSTNRALLEQIFALEDQQSQAQSAAAALQGVNSALSGLAGTRVNLQAELLTLQGDTAGAARLRREAELATLTAGMSAQDAARIAAAYDLNAALQQQIDETRSAQQAAEAIAQAQARAAEEAQRASEQVTRAWQGVTDSIYDEVARIRGLFDGNSPASLAAAQTQFTLTNASAQAGNQEAAKLLPALSRTLIDLATAQATTLAEVERVRAATAASLEQTGSMLAGRYGLSIPKLATGTPYVPQDMLAMLHEGEAVIPKAYNPAAGASDSTAAEIRQLRAQVETLTALLARTAGATEKSRDLLNSVTEGGRAMQTEPAT